MDSVKDLTDLRDQRGASELLQALATTRRPVTEHMARTDGAGKGTLRLPDIQNCDDLLSEHIPEPPQLIHGLLHQGSKMVLGGGSKSNKTWSLMDLALSVACGQPWWGFPTAKAKVLYINLELPNWSFKKRIEEIKAARFELGKTSGLDVWNLRGYAASIELLRPQMVERIKAGYGLIIIDPIYKVYGDRDENSAGEMGILLNEIERLTVETGAAVIFGAHFSKGNQSAKESIDRISGSGVFARDPDTILVMTKHEVEDTFTVEATLRNFKPIAPFCVQRAHPLMERNDNLDAAKLKQPGFKTKYTEEQLLDVLADQTLTTTAWSQQTAHKTNMSKRTFMDKMKGLKSSGTIIQNTEGEWHKPTTNAAKDTQGAEVQQVQLHQSH